MGRFRGISPIKASGMNEMGTPRGVARMRKVTENRKVTKGDFGRISRKDRCQDVMEDGQRCKQKAWRGKQVCYQHDPEMAELRRKAGRPAYAEASAGKPRNPVRLMTTRDVQELLAETAEDLRAGTIGAGEAYATGYLAQLALAAQGAARRESKLDVKHFWEVVDLGAAIERALKMQEERKREAQAGAGGNTGEVIPEPSVPGRDNLAGSAGSGAEV